MQHELSYHILDGAVLDEVIGPIQRRYDLEEKPVYVVSRTYLDSFDNRLYSGGVQLWLEQKEGVTTLYQNGIPKSSPARRFALSESIPKTAGDLPNSPAREIISKLLGIRALMQQIEVKIRVYSFHILDDEKKTVLRVHVEDSECRMPGKGNYIACGSRLRIQPVRGYPEPLIQIKKIISKKSDFAIVEDGLFEQGLNLIGKRVCGYSSKISFRFDPAMASIIAARQIHFHLLEIVEANISGVKKDLDTEFLHDMRVAVRRIRSALTQIKGVFHSADVNRFKSRLAWVGKVTGPTRDMDVFLLEFERYRACLPERFRDDLNPLHDFLVSHQKMEHGVLVKKLNSPYFRTLIKELREFSENTTGQDDAPEAATPISELADKRIYKMYRRVMHDGKAVADDSPAEHLHDLRKECKKLRYLMEFFRSLYPEKKIRQLIKSLKHLLDNLGNYQDLEVQADKLRDYARQMVEEGDTPHDTLLAMGMLVDALLSKQQQAREEFADHFAKFSQPDNQKVFQKLFAPSNKKGKG